MELELKPDFGQTLARFEAWWHCQIVDRPPVSLDVRPDRPPVPAPKKDHANWRDYWFDLEYRLDLAEAKPSQQPAPDRQHPAFSFRTWGRRCARRCSAPTWNSAGAPPGANRVGGCREIPNLPPNLDNPYWNAVRKLTEMSLERGAGR